MTDSSVPKPTARKQQLRAPKLCVQFVVAVLLLAVYRNGVPTSLQATVYGKSSSFYNLDTDNDPFSNPSLPSQFLFLNDPTLHPDLSGIVDRSWLVDKSLPKPPYKLILTDIGWN